MVPIHRRKLVVQKAQQGKLFEIPKSPLTREGFAQSLKAVGPRTLASLRSPFGIASLIAGAGGLDYLTSDRDELKQKRDDLIYQLGKGAREKKAEAFIASETGPAIPGSDLELRRKADLEREAMGDVGQYDRNVQNVQPPTVTGQPLGTNSAQVGVDLQKNTLDKANEVMRNLERQSAREGRLAQLKEVKDLVKDIMGEEGYDKAGNLMLLQLAANLVSGRTDKPGFGGFLDVLGQAGSKVIPMVIALDRERQKDELDLTKALISTMSKKDLDKINPPKERALITDSTGKDKIVYISTTDTGNFIAFDQINGVPTKYSVAPSQVKKIFDLKEDEKLNTKLLAEYQSLQSGEIVTRNLMELVAKNPAAVSNLGAAKFLSSNIYGQLKIAFGGSDYNETFTNMANELSNNALNAVDPTKTPISAKDSAKIANLINKDMNAINVYGQQLQSGSEEIKAQAAIKLFETVATYSLAQTLKKQDRLAVSDVENAKRQLGDVISFGLNRDAGSILAAYSIVNADFRKKMKELETTARYQGQSSIDNLMKQQQETYNKAGITTPVQNLVQKTDSKNQTDFNKMFSREKIGDALLK